MWSIRVCGHCYLPAGADWRGLHRNCHHAETWTCMLAGEPELRLRACADEAGCRQEAFRRVEETGDMLAGAPSARTSAANRSAARCPSIFGVELERRRLVAASHDVARGSDCSTQALAEAILRSYRALGTVPSCAVDLRWSISLCDC
jgi:hypothetical protein